MSALEAQLRDLAGLASIDRLRRLMPRAGVDFASNDYLALASSPRLAGAIRAAIDEGVPVGSGGSRLLRGNHAEHEALEADAAAWFGSESALYFSSGYAANAALIATLPQRGDLVVHDQLVHASAHEGVRMGFATRARARHNDPQAFDDAIAGWRTRGGKGQAWIVVESLYSMDGDRAPIAELAEVAARHDAMMLIDEAHATGVFGPGGRGLASAWDGRT
jgi:8-amino-7-oxononanoate synthase